MENNEKRRLTKGEKAIVILIAIVLLAAAAAVVIGLSLSRNVEEENVPAPAAKHDQTVVYKTVEKFVEIEKEISCDIIQDGLNDMGVLITEEYYFTEVVSYSSVKKLFKTDIELKLTESNYLASYDGVVAAGFDFTGITVEKDDEAKTITVHIPKAEIQYVDIDPDSFEIYSEKEGLGNPITLEDYNRSLLELEATAKTKAVNRGLLDRANENAQAVITNFITGLTGGDYSIQFAA